MLAPFGNPMMLFPPQEAGFTWNAVGKYVRVYASYDFLSGPAIGKEKNGFLHPLDKKRR